MSKDIHPTGVQDITIAAAMAKANTVGLIIIVSWILVIVAHVTGKTRTVHTTLFGSAVELQHASRPRKSPPIIRIGGSSVSLFESVFDRLQNADEAKA